VTLPITVAQRIAFQRNHLGLTQSQLARRAGVKTSTLQAWETGRKEPRADKLLRLAGILQVSLVWLMSGNTPDDAVNAASAPETERIAQTLDRALSLQHDLAALLIDVSADVTRLQRELDDDDDGTEELAAA
jgi:transcriptional regulator with XRE-family HTH domain